MKALRYVLPALAVVSVIAGYAMRGAIDGAPHIPPLIGSLVAAALVCLAIITVDARRGILVTSAALLVPSGYLLSHKLNPDAGPMICTGNAWLDCGKINDSVYSEIGGIPISLLGAGLYAGLALAAMASREKVPHLFRMTVLLMVPALLYSLFLAWASKQVGALCLFCISMYVGHVLLLIAGIKGLRDAKESAWSNLWAALSSRTMVTVAGTFAVVVLVGSAVLAGGGGRSGGPTLAVDSTGVVPSDTLASLYRDVPGPLPLDGTEPILGDPDAPYVIVEWADFGCGHCAHAVGVLDAIVASNPAIQLRFKSFPLAGPCDAEPPPGSPDGFASDRCRAAVAAECAHRQGKFWEYSHAVFKNLGYMAYDDLKFHADHKGLDVDAWEACMADPTALQSVVADHEAGLSMGVRGTPSIFLIGLRDGPIQLLASPDTIEALVDAVQTGRALPPGTAAPEG